MSEISEKKYIYKYMTECSAKHKYKLSSQLGLF